MLFVTYLKSLVKDALDAYQLSVLESELMRKQHYIEENGVLKHKSTKREHPGGETHEIPEKTQHNVEDFLVEEIKLETEVDIYSRRDKVYTAVKKGMFKRHPNVRIKITLSRVPPSEGVHTHIDSITEDLKEKM